ncbi:radical SAM protein [Bacillus pseudomycoides]|uniref:radical SAM/SPASM domain-containing protein n=1 Tax=Bacillus TaxID=1386 RepID=UPI000BF1518F|nr:MULTISPECIES: radical SAM protein [Bacillus]MCX2829466.1 radical SAM protein [Bacillus sp. DHT2]MDR4916739.1 radical SAM protein [Bacillus pseudomycoides]PEK39640.1 radical SAM protein [Bacillus pseudomycoides]PEK66397.1 radical SAM protein [Bacillus pseudomycoides]PEP38733.1 radical SAM protein [Bacillus pseudomycoides]
MNQLNNTDFFESRLYSMDIDIKSIREKLLHELKTEFAQNLHHYSTEADLTGVINYLENPTIHYSEGRDLSFDKQSFSVTELKNVMKLPTFKERIQYLVYRYRFNNYPRNQLTSEFPIVLCIEPTSICNLRCTMCFQSDSTFSGDKSLQGHMSFELFKKIIDEGAKHNLASIVLASRGEPLLNKDIYRMISYAKKNGVLDIKLNTNATVLTANNARKLLESGLDTLVFSVDSAIPEEYERIRLGAKFEKVVENIRRFNKIRQEEYPEVSLRTRTSMVVVDEDQDIEYAKEFWSGLVDEFAYRKVIDRLNIYEGIDISTERPCSLLWERLYIWFDGTTSICDEDYKSILAPGKFEGNTSISEIWKGKRYQQLRQMHIKQEKCRLHPCDKCPGF